MKVQELLEAAVKAKPIAAALTEEEKIRDFILWRKVSLLTRRRF